MRIAELSERSGVSPASIKFYAREGLLPPAERTGYNQVDYTDAHVRRLRLVRALIDVGGLSVARVREVVAVIDDDAAPLRHVLAATQAALPRGATGVADRTAPSTASRAAVEEVVARRGWRAVSTNPGFDQATAVLDAWAGLDRKDLFATLDGYSRAAELAAAADLDRVAADLGDRNRAAETVVVGTVLGDALIAGLRRIAQEHVSGSRCPLPTRTPAESTEEQP